MQKVLRIQIAGFGLFGKDHRQVAEILRRNAGDCDARSFDGQNFIDAPARKAPGKFLPYLAEQGDIQLVV